MALRDPRAQLLANLKCLYGPDVEVFTLCDENLGVQYQAVAMRFDSLHATWTKFLHTELDCTSTRDSINALLQESERRLGKLFSAGGDTVPFHGTMVQTLTLQHRQQGDSNSGGSMQSEPIVIATPASDDNSDNFVHAEHQVEVAASGEPSVDEAPLEVAVVMDVNAKSLADGHISVSEEVEAVSQESEMIGFGWVSSGFSKKGKKGKKKKRSVFTFDEIQPAEEDCAEIPAEEPPTESKGEHSLEKVCNAYQYIEEFPACQPDPAPEPTDDLYWGIPSSKSKKKKGKMLFGEEEPPTPSEPAPEPEDNLGWGALPSSKRDKKKKGKMMYEDEEPPAPFEPQQSRVGFGWGDLLRSIKDRDGKGENLTEKENDPFSEVEPDSYPVGKCEECKEDEPPSAPLPLSSSPPSPSLPLPAPSQCQPETGNSVLGILRSEASLLPESTLFAQNHRAVVFKIEFPNEISKESLQVMTTITDDTRTAIINSANSYLDSKSIGLQGQRKLEIKYGVGRNGDVDLSALEERSWPEYLGYFCQYTKIPELTIDVLEC